MLRFIVLYYIIIRYYSWKSEVFINNHWRILISSLQFGTVKSLNCQFDLVIHQISCELLRSIKILRF